MKVYNCVCVNDVILKVADELKGLCQRLLCFSGSNDPDLRIIDHDLCFSQLFRSPTDYLRGGKKCMRKGRKINRFPLSSWAVSLACQRSCYSGGTRATWAHTQSLLTRGKHADRHQEQVGTQICTSSSRPKRYCARPPRGKGRGAGLRMVGIGVGWWESQPAFFYCLTV